MGQALDLKHTTCEESSVATLVTEARAQPGMGAANPAFANIREQGHRQARTEGRAKAESVVETDDILL